MGCLIKLSQNLTPVVADLLGFAGGSPGAGGGGGGAGAGGRGVSDI